MTSPHSTTAFLLLVLALACRPPEPRVVHLRGPSLTTLMVGDTLHLQVAVCRGRAAQCGLDTTITIETSDANVASVDSSGTVRALAPGRAVVTLRATGARADTISVRVVPRVARVVISPEHVTVGRRDSVVFEVRAFDASGNEVRDPPVWFEHSARRSRGGLRSPRIVLFDLRPGTQRLIARVGAVEDTVTFLVR